MRRVNEAVREVLCDAITADLKDPRIGFVTVTGVETSPDLRHARVFVSVLGDEDEREATPRRPAVRRTASCRRRVGRELRMKHTPTLEFVYDESIDRGHADHRAARRGATDAVSDDDAPSRRATQVLEELRGAPTSSCSPRTRTPTATRSARCSPCTRCSSSSARTR